MKKALKKHLALLSLLLLFLVWGLWYSHPVGVETLFPDMEPDLIDIFLIDSHGVGAAENRGLQLEAGTEAFDALWEELQGLRFRRSPFNPVKQALPFLDGCVSGGKTIQKDEINLMNICLVQDNGQETWRSEQLQFRIDAWTYEDWDRDVTLSLWTQDGKAVGQELAHRLWDQAKN